MATKNLNKVHLIQDPMSRKVTYCKRKKGIIKKAMEISILCGQNVAMFIYDKELQKLVMY